jgi:hypothetical protein
VSDSSVPITAGSGTAIRALTALGAASAAQQVMTLADSAGNLLGTSGAPVPVAVPDVTASGSITAASGVGNSSVGAFSSTALAANSSVSITTTGDAVVTVAWQGNTSNNQITFEGTLDGTNWTPLIGTLSSTAGAQANITSTAAGLARFPAAGMSSVRTRSVTSWTASTVTVNMRASSAAGMASLFEPLLAGANTIGNVGIIGGGNTASVKAASTAVLGSDLALVVGLHPASPLPTGTNTIGNVGTLAELRASTLCVTATAASGSAATATLPSASGLFHYITGIDIVLYSAAARTGGATPWIVTTTNLPGSPAWDFSTAGAIGTTERQFLTPTTPLKSSAGTTATTVVGPAATGGIWRITVTYFTAA